MNMLIYDYIYYVLVASKLRVEILSSFCNEMCSLNLGFLELITIDMNLYSFNNFNE